MSKVSPEDYNRYGEAATFDPHFKGPVKARSCTDVLCCALYLAFLAGLGVVGYFAYKTGDPNRLLYPTDSSGNICGVNNTESGRDFSAKPYVFYFDLSTCGNLQTLIQMQCPTKQICVQHCPQLYWLSVTDLLPTATVSYSKFDEFCYYGFDPSTSTDPLDVIINKEQCPPYLLKSRPIFGRCIPTLIEDIATADVEVSGDGLEIGGVKLELPGTDGTPNKAVEMASLYEAVKLITEYLDLHNVSIKIFDDFVEVWPWILGLLGLAMLLSFLCIVVMRWIAGFMIWFIIIALIAGLGFSLWFTIDKYVTLTNAKPWIWTTNLDYYVTTTEFWLAMAIISGVVLVIIVLLTIVLFKRIRLAIKLIEEASHAISCNITSLFFPLINYVWIVACLSGFGVIAIYLASNGTATYKITSLDSDRDSKPCTPSTFEPETGDEKCVFVNYGGDPNIFRLHIYNVLALFWNTNFVIGLGQVTLAGVFASWYWAFRKPQDVPTFSLTAALWRALRYHLGSIAFGALIIALIQMIRAALEYVERKLKKNDNALTSFLIKCLKCCFWCLEKILRFITKNAYIMIAVKGTNFCSSAKAAFSLILRNILRVTVLNSVTTFLLILAKMLVVILTTGAAFLLFSGYFNIPYLQKLQLNYFWVPLIIVILGSYAVAAVFFDVYDMAIDTIFLCFLEDCERNDGSAGRPYFMAKSLLSLLGKENKLGPTEGR